MTQIGEATEKYESWLEERIPVIRKDLDRKHELMRSGPFPFLRATFYRWAQTYPEVCPDLMTAPVVLGVGDLHVENFGTWRDIEGRLIWGINDFDEVCQLPYTADLVRLATSALLAVEAGHLHISAARASQAILSGYRACLSSGGQAFVLAEGHLALRHMAVERLKEPEKFWEKLESLAALRQPPPSSAAKALRRMLPERDLAYRVRHRVSGMGSLGRRRFFALVQWRGGYIAREAKELTESAWYFAHPTGGKAKVLYQKALDCAIRSQDPFVRLKGRWIVRRLAPDCSRIELTSLPTKNDARRLLHAMGWETANVHLGSIRASEVLKDLKTRKQGWLNAAAVAMKKSTHEDWEQWRWQPR
jgi:hypothetical protein